MRVLLLPRLRLFFALVTAPLGTIGNGDIGASDNIQNLLGRISGNIEERGMISSGARAAVQCSDAVGSVLCRPKPKRTGPSSSVHTQEHPATGAAMTSQDVKLVL